MVVDDSERQEAKDRIASQETSPSKEILLTSSYKTHHLLAQKYAQANEYGQPRRTFQSC